MAQDNEIPAYGVIESAMDRVASEGAALKESTSVGRRKYDEALTRRLSQIHAALGSDDPQEVSIPQASEHHAGPRTSPGFDSSTVRAGGGYPFGALVFTAGFAAIAGAGLMWLAMNVADRGIVPKPVAIEPIAMPAQPVAVAPVAPPVAAVPDAEAEARELVERWRQAWSSRDIEAYLRCYSPDFVPAKGETHARWAAERRKKLTVPSDINVHVHHMNIERIDDEQMKVVFQQDYASGNYRELAQPKTLLLSRTGGEWLIAGEWMGTSPPSSLVRK